MDKYVGPANVRILVKNFFESFTAVSGAKDAALFVRAVGMAGHRHQYAIRIARVDCDLRNLLPVAQTEMRPGHSRISRFVYPVANRKFGTLQPSPPPHLNNIWFRTR